jgi:HD-GYP domain-containing protein (c-di-GMP phosphodiesterase class II)
MLKSHLDSYISTNYEMLLSIANGLNKKNGRDYDPAILVSEAYEHVLNLIDRIDTTDTMQRYLIAKISMESRFRNSRTNRQQAVNEIAEIPDTAIEDDECELSKLDRRVQAYYNNADRIKQIMWEAYYIKGHSSCRKFAAYFNFSHATAHNLIKQLKKEVYEQEI